MNNINTNGTIDWSSMGNTNEVVHSNSTTQSTETITNELPIINIPVEEDNSGTISNDQEVTTETEQSVEVFLRNHGHISDIDYICMLSNNIVYQSLSDQVDRINRLGKLDPVCSKLFNKVIELHKDSSNSIGKYYSLSLVVPESYRERVAKLVSFFSTLTSFTEISQLAKSLSEYCNSILFEHYVLDFTSHRDMSRLYKDVTSLDMKPIKVLPTSNFSDITVSDLESRLLNTEVLPSVIDEINKTNDLGGYIKGSLVTVAGAPGCLVGTTKVKVLDESVFIEDIYNNQSRYKSGPVFKLWGMNQFTHRPTMVTSPEVRLTKHVTKTIRISFKESGTNPVECTIDHQWYVGSGPLGKWMTATEILETVNSGSKVEFYTYSSSIKICRNGYSERTKIANPTMEVASAEYVEYDEPIPVYDMIDSGPWSNYAIDIGSTNAIISHNSGKSNFLMYEAFNLSFRHKKRGFWLALGDLMDIDFIARFGSIYWQKPKQEIINNLSEYYTEEFRTDLGKYLDFSIVEPGKLSVEEFVESMKEKLAKAQDGFYDYIVVDYDSNFSNLANTNSMFEAHGIIYNELVALAKSGPKCLVFVASQIKTEFQDSEIIPINGLAESSRKQNIIDMLLTISRKAIPDTSNHDTTGDLTIPMLGQSVQASHISALKRYPDATSYGFINKAKERRGNTISIPYVSSSYFYHPIGRDEYNQLKSLSNNRRL